MSSVLRRAIATALELAEQQRRQPLDDDDDVLDSDEGSDEEESGLTTVELPNGWILTAASAEDFELELPDGSICTTHEALRKQLDALDNGQNDAEKAPPLPADDDVTRKSGRKRMKPLDFWANERVVYDHGEVIGALVNTAGGDQAFA